MICGIDEAGRGPIAGPLYVAGCILKNDIDGLNDSKKLTEKKREALFQKIIENSEYKIISFSNIQIDELGLSFCLKSALKEIKIHFKKFECEFLYDGNTSFGVSNIKTLIKADALIKEVSAASILAKVSRDKEIIQLDSDYPLYNFKKHKGYGSKSHIDSIIKHGYCEIHRKSFKIKSLEKNFFN